MPSHRRGRPCRARRALAIIAAVASIVAATVRPLPASAAAGASTLTAPVEAPVIDPFRPPRTPWGSGNLGLEYATTPGAEVRAPAAGVVVFAGQVAGSRHVTVRHGPELRSTVSFLAEVAVVSGQRVGRGELLGTAPRRLHLGVRVGDRYVDPAPLLRGPAMVARLVADDLLAGSGPAAARAEAALLAALPHSAGGGGFLSLLPGGRTLLRALDSLLPATVGRDAALALLAWRVRSRSCSPASIVAAPPGGRRIAVLVGGLGSSSDAAGIDDLDVAALGYAPGDVLRASYEGGRTPGAVRADLSHIDVTTYDAAATQRDVRLAGGHLGDLLVDVAEAAPGTPIDVYAHSQGGLVTAMAVADARLPPVVDHVVTVSTPHGGADLATDLVTARAVPGVDGLLALIGPIGGLDLTAPSPSALAEGSSMLTGIGAPRPTVRFLAIGARGDLVVPAPRSGVPGRPHVIVSTAGPRAHHDVVSAPATTRAVALSLAGLPAACEALGDVLLDSLVGSGVVAVEDGLGAAVAVAGDLLGG